MQRRTWKVCAKLAVGLFATQVGLVEAAGIPRIVNGLTTHDFPTVGALLYGAGGVPITADNGTIVCTGTLVGCRSFLTAAHCVAPDLDPTHYAVFLQHGGVLAASSVAFHPGYDGTHAGHDVAVVGLAADATGIAPTAINATHDLALLGVGLPGTIAGFGKTAATSLDFAIKRYGAVQTASCLPSVTGGEGNDKLVCWDFAIPVGPPGTDSDTCNGDSGGPLFIDFAGTTEVVGVTSTGSSPFCRPLDHAFDAAVFYNASWIAGAMGADSVATCGGIGPVGTPAATVTPFDGTLAPAHPSDALGFVVSGGTTVLRVALNGQYNAIFDANLYVKAGAPASPSDFDCKADGLGVFGSCEFVQPAAGSWSALVVAAAGAGQYQLTVTAFASTGATCGNGTIDAGEQCDDGVTNGTAASCCTAACVLAPAATPCADDGNPCTVDACDGASAACGHQPGNAGTICRPAADACDVAERCDGIAADCPADVRAPDADGDGLCDGLDPCTNRGHAQDFLGAPPPHLVLNRVNTDPVVGNDTLKLTGAFALPAGDTFASLDPMTRGARVVVTNASGTHVVLDVVLPPGPFDGRATRGWKADRSGTAWVFSDRTDAPIDGIVTVRFEAPGSQVPAVAVTVTGKRSSYDVAPEDDPLHAIVVAGDQTDAIAGRCGETAFTAAQCAFDRKGDTVTCKVAGR